MAQRRMISKGFINDDNFTLIGQAPRLLYIYFIANADDDGLIRQKRNMFALSGAGEEDLEVLIDQGYVYRFPTGTIVIMDWNVHNKVPATRHTPTQFWEEYAHLEVNRKGRYIVHENPVQTQEREVETKAGHANAGEDSEDYARSDSVGTTTEHNAMTEPSICPYEAIVAAFREDCPSYTAPRLLSAKQKKKLDLLWTKFSTLEEVRAVFTKAEKSDFLRNGLNRPCTFDWIISIENADKINMGNFSSPSRSGSSNSFETNDFFGAALRRSLGDELVDQLRQGQDCT